MYYPRMATQDDYVKTALRLPKGLHLKLQEAADATGKSMNAEIIARLERAFAAPDQTLILSAFARLETALAQAELEKVSERASTMFFALNLRDACERALPFVDDMKTREALEQWATEASGIIHGVDQLEADFKDRLNKIQKSLSTMESLIAPDSSEVSDAGKPLGSRGRSSTRRVIRTKPAKG